MNKFWESQRRMWENANKLWENVGKLWEEVKALREDQHRLWEEVRELRREVRGVKTTVERVTLSLKEEARSFTTWRLEEALGVEVVLDRVFDALEINVYGVTGDLCVVEEATVRLGLGLVEELLKKVEVLSSSIAYSGTSAVVKRYC